MSSTKPYTSPYRTKMSSTGQPFQPYQPNETNPQWPWDHDLIALQEFVHKHPYLLRPLPTNTSIDNQLHDNNELHGTIVLPLWHNYALFNPASPHWNDAQILLTKLSSRMLLASDGHFEKTHPIAFHKAADVFTYRLRSDLASTFHNQPDMIRRPNMCFESMRISVNLALEPGLLANGLHSASHVVVHTFGRFIGGELLLKEAGSVEVVEMAPMKPGEWFVLEAGQELGTKPFRGERYQVELFVSDGQLLSAEQQTAWSRKLSALDGVANQRGDDDKENVTEQSNDTEERVVPPTKEYS